MKVHKSVKLELSKEELEAVQVVFNMLNDIEIDERDAIDDCLTLGCSIEDVRVALIDLWELSGHDSNHL